MVEPGIDGACEQPDLPWSDDHAPVLAHDRLRDLAYAGLGGDQLAEDATGCDDDLEAGVLGAGDGTDHLRMEAAGLGQGAVEIDRDGPEVAATAGRGP